MSNTNNQANLEPGLLTRVRSLRDLLPWLALGDALRPATSVIATLLSMTALWLIIFGFHLIDRISGATALAVLPATATAHPMQITQQPPFAPLLISPSQATMPECAVYFSGPLSETLWHSMSPRQFAASIAKQYWMWIVWMIPAGYVMRKAALAVGGRRGESSSEVIGLLKLRWGAFIGGPSIALGAVGLVAVLFYAIRLLCEIPAIGTISGWICFPLAITAGLLLGGVLVGTVLMWAAAVSEEYADAFDVASRGFEYLFQRPLKTVFYMVLASLVSLVMTTIFSTIAALAVRLACGVNWQQMLGEVKPAYVPLLAATMLDAYAMNLFFSLSAIVYLLLRHDANHRELEDVWMPPRSEQSLPQLKLDENGVPIPSS